MELLRGNCAVVIDGCRSLCIGQQGISKIIEEVLEVIGLEIWGFTGIMIE